MLLFGYAFTSTLTEELIDVEPILVYVCSVSAVGLVLIGRGDTVSGSVVSILRLVHCLEVVREI